MRHTEATKVDRQALGGRSVVVTGAASGIGRAVALAASRAGASVAALDVDGPGLSRLGAECAGHAGRVIAVETDVTEPEQAQAAHEQVRRTLGCTDFVVANAGVAFGGPFGSSGPREWGEWQQMIAVNVSGMLHTARAFVGDLLITADDRRPADLVIIGSVASRLLPIEFSVYALTAAARAQLAKALRAELSGRGVRVRIVEPGTTLTGLGRGITNAHARASLDEMRMVESPLLPEDVARTIIFSASMPVGVNIAEALVLPTRQG